MTVDLLAGGNQVIEAKNIILAVGSEVTPLPTCPVDNAGGSFSVYCPHSLTYSLYLPTVLQIPGQKVVDSTGALVLQTVPKRLAVIGGGVIGLEMGSVWNRLGSEVPTASSAFSPGPIY